MSTDTTRFEDLPFVCTGRVSEHGEGSTHQVQVGYVYHPGGMSQPVVEVLEHHDGYSVSRRFAISTLVHLAVNATESEIWEIGDRERDYRNEATPTGRISTQP